MKTINVLPINDVDKTMFVKASFTLIFPVDMTHSFLCLRKLEDGRSRNSKEKLI